MRISVHIATRDRHSEIACLLTALRCQTVQDFDLVIVDESQTPLTTHVPTMFLLARLKQEGHKVVLFRNEFSRGVCHARNLCIEQDCFGDEYTLRIDDDTIPEPDYIERLLEVINSGYDIASGVTPLMSQPEIFVHANKKVLNEIKVDTEGNILEFGDDCGHSYYEDKILPAHHFRSCCLYKSEINTKVKYEENLSPVGFREESFWSIRVRQLGYKIGVNTGAKNYHFCCPSGGCRYSNYSELVRQDDETFRAWYKRQVQNKRF